MFFINTNTYHAMKQQRTDRFSFVDRRLGSLNVIVITLTKSIWSTKGCINRYPGNGSGILNASNQL